MGGGGRLAPGGGGGGAGGGRRQNAGARALAATQPAPPHRRRFRVTAAGLAREGRLAAHRGGFLTPTPSRGGPGSPAEAARLPSRAPPGARPAPRPSVEPGLRPLWPSSRADLGRRGQLPPTPTRPDPLGRGRRKMARGSAGPGSGPARHRPAPPPQTATEPLPGGSQPSPFDPTHLRRAAARCPDNGCARNAETAERESGGSRGHPKRLERPERAEYGRECS